MTQPMTPNDERAQIRAEAVRGRVERFHNYWRTWRSLGAARMDHRLWLHWAIFGRYPS